MILILWLLAQAWTEGSLIGVPTDSSKHPIVVYVWGTGATAESNIPRRVLAPDVWHTIDLTDPLMPANHVPADTNAIALGGLLGSSGQPSVVCGVVATFRAPGSTMEALDYQIQGVAMPGAGFRATATVMVPLRDRQFEFWWHPTDAACPIFLSLSVQWYVRGGAILPSPPTPIQVLSAIVTETTIRVVVAQGPGHRLDWVSLYPYGSNHFVEWQYLNGSPTAPVQGLTEATLVFRRPPPGLYVLRLFSAATSTFLVNASVRVP